MDCVHMTFDSDEMDAHQQSDLLQFHFDANTYYGVAINQVTTH
jgi:hypothetical protein